MYIIYTHIQQNIQTNYIQSRLQEQMQKYHGFDQTFYDFMFGYIVKNGGVRMQVIASDLAKYLQDNYDTKDPLNLFRKQYGNIYEALKAIKKPYFILDNMVIKMKKPQEVRALNIKKQLMQQYQAQLQINTQKQIATMKINNENVCSVCDKTYNVNVNKPGMCGPGKGHSPKH